jgi:hypothetical protein
VIQKLVIEKRLPNPLTRAQRADVRARIQALLEEHERSKNGPIPF